MSEGDRLFHPVTGSLAAIFLMLLAAGSVSHANRYHSDHHSQHQPGANQAQSSVPLAGPSSLGEQPSADDRKYAREEADLRAQQGMVGAAWTGVVISGFALAALLVTIHFARMAWLAAKDSAKADNDALELTRTQLMEARDTAEVQSRAYCLIDGTDVRRIPTTKEKSLSDLEPFELELLAASKNTGQTPAFDVGIIATIFFGAEDDLKAKTIRDSRARSIIGPGQSVHFERRTKDGLTNAKIKEFVAKGCTLWLKGTITYTDVYGDVWQYAFASKIKNLLQFCEADSSSPMMPHVGSNTLTLIKKREHKEEK